MISLLKKFCLVFLIMVLSLASLSVEALAIPGLYGALSIALCLVAILNKIKFTILECTILMMVFGLITGLEARYHVTGSALMLISLWILTAVPTIRGTLNCK